MRNRMLSVAMLALLVPAIVILVGAQPKDKTAKTHFLVELKHTPEECLADLDRMSADAPKFLDRIEWGCMAGDHTGYAIIAAESEEAVRNMLPAADRDKARIVAVNKFTIDQIRSFHKK